MIKATIIIFKGVLLMMFSKLNKKSAILVFTLGIAFVLTIFFDVLGHDATLNLANSTYTLLKSSSLFTNTILIALAFILGRALDLKGLKASKLIQFYVTLLCFSVPLIPVLFSIDVSTINGLPLLKSIFPFTVSEYWFTTIILLFVIVFYAWKIIKPIHLNIKTCTWSLLAIFVLIFIAAIFLSKYEHIIIILWASYAFILGSFLQQQQIDFATPKLVQVATFIVEIALIMLVFISPSNFILQLALPSWTIIFFVSQSIWLFDNDPHYQMLSMSMTTISIGFTLLFANPLSRQVLNRYVQQQNPNLLPNILRHLLVFSLIVLILAFIYSLIVSLGLALRSQEIKNKLFTLPVVIFLISSCYLIFNYSQFYGQGLKTLIWRQDGRLYLGLINLALVALLYVIIQTIFNRFWFANTTFVMLMIIWSYANFAKISARDEPIIGSDLGMIKSLPDIAKMVNLKMVFALIIALVVLIAGSFLLQHYFLKGKIYRLPVRILLFAGSCLILIGFAQTEKQLNLIAWKNQKPVNDNVFSTMLNTAGYQAHPESLQNAASKFGPATTFMGTLIIKTMEKPNNYSKKQIINITKKYTKASDKINKTRKNKSLNSQTIVYILSESYADPRMVPSVKLSKNPIPYEQKIAQKNTSGLMYSSGYGGGTANIEFEALTGLSMNNFDPSLITPYVFLVPKVSNLPVVTDYFKTKNAIHPYNGTTYNRSTVFKKFGFQHFYNFNGNKLTYTNRIGKSPYVSDDSSYRQLLKQLDSTKKGQFVQLSTMQNHMPYVPGTYAKNDYKATGQLTNSSLKKIESYSKGLNYTDQALKMLINKISKMKKHVTIVWYGDHLPGLYDGSIVSGSNAAKYDNRLHQTNYFIYSNFTHQKLQNTKVVSPNMFTPMVFQQTDTKVSPYVALLTEVYRHVPAAERNKFMNSNGNYIPKGKLSKQAKLILKDYKLIQYDITAGKQYSIKTKNFIK